MEKYVGDIRVKFLNSDVSNKKLFVIVKKVCKIGSFLDKKQEKKPEFWKRKKNRSVFLHTS